ISDFVAHESVANEFRPKSTEMDHARAADERADESDHEIDRVVCGQNAEIPRSGPEWIPGSQGLALLEIIFMSEYATLGAAAGAGGIHDASCVFAGAGYKVRVALAAEFFPAISTAELCGGRRLGH